MQGEQERVCETKEIKGLLFFNKKNSLADADSFLLYGERYDEFCMARETINKVYRFEELFAIVLAAAFDYDMLEANLLDRARYMINMEHALYQNGIEMNHKLLGFLSSLCTYCEAVRDTFGDKCKLEPDTFYDGWLKRCKAIRNYMIHVACLPYSNSLAYSLCATNDILTNVQLSFKVDELNLARVHPRTKELFDSCFGANERVDISEVVANGLRAAGELQKIIRKYFDKEDGYKRAVENQLEYDRTYKEKGLDKCFALHGEWNREEPQKNVGLLCKLPFTLIGNIRAIEFLQARNSHFNTRQQMYVTNVPKESLDKVVQAANHVLGLRLKDIIPLDMSGVTEDIRRQAYGE